MGSRWRRAAPDVGRGRTGLLGTSSKARRGTGVGLVPLASGERSRVRAHLASRGHLRVQPARDYRLLRRGPRIARSWAGNRHGPLMGRPCRRGVGCGPPTVSGPACGDRRLSRRQRWFGFGCRSQRHPSRAGAGVCPARQPAVVRRSGTRPRRGGRQEAGRGDLDLLLRSGLADVLRRSALAAGRRISRGSGARCG